MSDGPSLIFNVPFAAFSALLVVTLDRTSLSSRLCEIGHAESASRPRPDVA